MTEKIAIQRGIYQGIYADTCGIIPNYQDNLQKSEEVLRIAQSWSAHRKNLEKVDGLYVIPEVIAELGEGLSRLEVLLESKWGRLREALNALRQEEQEMMDFAYKRRIATSETRKRFPRLPENKVRKVREIILAMGGKLNDLETDLEVITAALCHAQISPTAVMTQDTVFRLAFAHCAHHIGFQLKSTAILRSLPGERYHMTPTREYLRDAHNALQGKAVSI